MSGAAEDDEKWTKVNQPTTEEDKRKVLGTVLKLAVIKIFKSNVYTFAGKLRV